MSENLGKVISGGASLGTEINARIVQSNLNISASFNMSATQNWKSVQSELFSYHNIYAQNRTVVLQLDESHGDYIPYLSSNFLADATRIHTSGDADNFLSKYGTHLLTGYTLGGIFKMTNYYATNSSSYVKENNTSFDAQVAAGMSFAGSGGEVGANFSFTQTYGMSDNNVYSTNQYKLVAHGGASFPGLTIDQTFSYYETAFGAGFMYDLWTDSINNGTGLVIVDVPSYSPLIPLYKLLPNSSQYVEAKSILLSTYLSKCQQEVAYYNKNNKDTRISDLSKPTDDGKDLSLKINGYEMYSPSSNGSYTYSKLSMSKGSNEIPSCKKGSIIALDYESSYPEYNLPNWSVSSSDINKVRVVDATNGVFEIISDSLADNTKIKVNCLLPDGTSISNLLLVFSKKDFIGNGTKEEPYLISSASDFVKFATQEKYYENSFKLMSDIDLSGYKVYPVGRFGKVYNGVFDGDFHKISNYVFDNDIAKDIVERDSGVEGTLSQCQSGIFGIVGEDGEIKNLNIDSAAIDISTSDSTFSKRFLCNAILAGINYGKITNCSVSNSNLSYDFSHTDSASSISYNIGLLVGFGRDNSNFKNCFVSNSSINASSLQASATLNIGGLIGAFATSLNPIECAGVSNVSITAKNTSSTTNRSISVGGLIGSSADRTSFKDIKVDSTKIKVSSNKAATNLRVSIGGLIGSYAATAIFNKEKFVAFDDIYLSFPKDAISFDGNGSSLSQGAIIGRCFPQDNSSQISDDYIGNAGIVALGKPSTLGSVAGGDKITISESYGTLSSFCEDNWEGEEESRRLKTHEISTVDFDFSNAKKTFYLNEAFSAGSIDVTSYFSDGGEGAKVSNYTIDSSDFDSKKVGKYNIKVASHGFDSTYQVEVLSPRFSSISVTQEANSSYYEGDSIDTVAINVVGYYKDGTKKNISLSDCTIEGPKNLSAGQNKIVITYDDCSDYCIVEAKERNITNVVLKKAPTKQDYFYRDQDIELDGLEVRVDYDNGAPSETVTYKGNEEDFSAFFTSMSTKGTTIKVSYDDYNLVEYKVRVTYDSTSQAAINSFIDSVAKLDAASNGDLSSYLNAIRKSSSLKDEIGGNPDDESYLDACRKLEEHKENYSRICQSINSDFDKAVKESSSLTFAGLSNVSYLVYGISALIILAFIF